MATDSMARGMANSGFHGTLLWDDIILSPESLGVAASAPDLVTFKGNILAYAFDGNATTEQLYGGFEMPHSYSEGTDLHLHIHWCPSNSDSGNVKWNFEYSLANSNEVFPDAITISTVVSTNSASHKHYKTDYPVISGTGLKIGTIVRFRLYRNPQDAQDTYGSDAFLLSIGIHYQINSNGSRAIPLK